MTSSERPGFMQMMRAPFLSSVLAPLIAYLVNGFRIALLAYCHAEGDKDAFDYWHEGDGAALFGLIAAVCLGAIYLWFKEVGRRGGWRSDG